MIASGSRSFGWCRVLSREAGSGFPYSSRYFEACQYYEPPQHPFYPCCMRGHRRAPLLQSYTPLPPSPFQPPFRGWDEGVVPRLMIDPVTGRVTRGSWFERLQPPDNGLGGGDGRLVDSDVGLVPSLSSSSSLSSLCSDDSQDVTRAARHLSTRCAVYILGNIPVEVSSDLSLPSCLCIRVTFRCR